MVHRVTLLALGLLMAGFAGGYVVRDAGVSFVLYHVGGLGAIGLLASAAAALAGKKGHAYWRAFSLALSLPVLLGIVAAYLVPSGGSGGRPAACGGTVSLAVGLVFIIYWALAKRRGKVNQ